MSNKVITANDLIAILNKIFNPLPQIDLYYPVGSYYETSDTTFNPNVSWGGTWSLDSAGKVTVAYDVNDTDFDTVGDTGGSKYIQAHTHAVSTQPTFNTPNHTHTTNVANDASAALSGSNPDNLGSVPRRTTSSSTVTTLSTNSTGGGVACSRTANVAIGAVSGLPSDQTTGDAGNMPPYIVVNRWHRTA